MADPAPQQITTADAASSEEPPVRTEDSVPAGWYPDPDPAGAARGRSRYFDGTTWSAFTREITEVIESARDQGIAGEYEAAHESALATMGRRQLEEEPVQLDPTEAAPLPSSGMRVGAPPRSRSRRVLVLAGLALVLCVGGAVGYEEAFAAPLQPATSPASPAR